MFGNWYCFTLSVKHDCSLLAHNYIPTKARNAFVRHHLVFASRRLKHTHRTVICAYRSRIATYNRITFGDVSAALFACSLLNSFIMCDVHAQMTTMASMARRVCIE